MIKNRSSYRRLIAALAVVGLVAAGCGGDDASESDGSSAPTEASASETDGTSTSETDDASASEAETTVDAEASEAGEAGPFRIAIVAPSAQNDLAFSQSMVDAVNSLKDDRDIQVDITDSTYVVADAAAAIRGYAEDGYDLVIAHGSQYGAPLQEIAPDFPDVAFAWGTLVDTFGMPNVSSYSVRSDEGAYVMGAIAAQISKSGVIGLVGPIEVGDAKLYSDGFKAGAEAQKPDIDVNINYIDSFSDVNLAAEAANAHVSAGADVLTGTAQMVVGATGVIREAGGAWFGNEVNQISLAPDNVVASQVYHWEVLLTDLVAEIEAGNLGGHIYEANLANGGIVIEYNDGYDLPDDVKAVADEIVAGIIDGSITTGASE
ncbi:MAG: BMP family ABC transporter substrate-binding protein [Ilumatobacter coccineus]|uniref:BMP family ABC transporter substrate-binding protein n=1 Tax=Ilumatobacter coccineus TaxID=467094 RepID=A0A2G6K9R1_9ACTN|nr:MAG: BMP family ABC transporter substrate-binding protein [Ilumatobacter coccineus]